MLLGLRTPLLGLAIALLCCCTQCARDLVPGTTSASVSPPAPPRVPLSTASRLGTNLAGIHDWTTEEPFVDVHKMARQMLGGTTEVWNDGHALDVDEHGWVRRLSPNEVGRSLVFTGSNTYRPGRYVVRHDGEGQILFAGSASVVEAESRPGRTVLDLRPARSRDETGITMDLLSVNPSNPLRNVRIYGAGGACDEDRTKYCDASTPCASGACLSFEEHSEQLMFHPDFLSKIQPFGMLRFMDFMNTNNSTIRTWSDRPRLEDATWSYRGVPLEAMIRLTNQMRVQPWFCIPHQADDQYVRAFAEQLRDGVDPDLRIWVEYSNELWNGIFEQHEYAQRRGEALGLSEGFQAVLHYQARRSVEIFRIFEEVLGTERIVRVMAAQASNRWVAEVLLEFEDTASHTDALAIAPYFGMIPGPAERAEVGRLSVDDLFQRIRGTLLPQVTAWTEQHAELAREHDVELVAYEAGQHFVGMQGAEDDERINALFDAVNRDPRMRDTYLTYLEGWKRAGGGWLNHFVSCEGWAKFGRWGALEHVRQSRREAPKYDALVTFAERYPQGW